MGTRSSGLWIAGSVVLATLVLLVLVLKQPGCTGQLSGGQLKGGGGDLRPGDLRPGTADLSGGDVRVGDAQPRDRSVGPDVGPPIWRPKPGTTWHWQLTGKLDLSVNAQMYDIDLFNTTAATIATLKAANRAVVCYTSVGSSEEWTPDFGDFPESVKGKDYEGWPKERWLDIRAPQVRAVMLKRLDLAQSKGCDGIEPDNMDGYNYDTGFPLTAKDQITYNTFLARA